MLKSTGIQFTLKEILVWIVRNCTGENSAYRNWKWETLANELVFAERAGQLHVFVNPDSGDLCGVVVAEIRLDRTIRVHNIFLAGISLFDLIKIAAANYPGYTITGKRSGRERRYDGLINRIL